MKLYIANCIDRHIDPVIKVFDTPDAAIAYCKSFVEDNARYADEVRETEVQGWLFHASYSCEGDHVYVTTTTLNDVMHIELKWGAV